MISVCLWRIVFGLLFPHHDVKEFDIFTSVWSSCFDSTLPNVTPPLSLGETAGSCCIMWNGLMEILMILIYCVMSSCKYEWKLCCPSWRGREGIVSSLSSIASYNNHFLRAEFVKWDVKLQFFVSFYISPASDVISVCFLYFFGPPSLIERLPVCLGPLKQQRSCISHRGIGANMPVALTLVFQQL